MITPEQLIYDFQKKISQLEKELEEAHQDIKDFEELAKTWKKSYGEIERGFRIAIGNKDQIIAELEKELSELKDLMF